MIARGAGFEPAPEAEGGADDAFGAVVIDDCGDAEGEGGDADWAVGEGEGEQAEQEGGDAEQAFVLGPEHGVAREADQRSVRGGAEGDEGARGDGGVAEHIGGDADEESKGDADQVATVGAGDHGDDHGQDLGVWGLRARSLALRAAAS